MGRHLEGDGRGTKTIRPHSLKPNIKQVGGVHSESHSGKEGKSTERKETYGKSRDGAREGWSDYVEDSGSFQGTQRKEKKNTKGSGRTDLEL